MSLRPIGIAICIVAIAAPLFWLPAIGAGKDKIALASQYLGMVALIAMAISQIIATRFAFVEWLFGGLDRAYILHKWLGISAMAAVLLHDTIDAEMRGLGQETLLTEVAETSGEIALYGLLILVVITVATFIPYHLWRWTHRLMGFLFAMAAFHYLFILKPFSNFDPLGLYVGGFCLLGIAAFIYRLLPAPMRPSKRYRVTELDQSGNALSVLMTPDAKPMRFRPGQFAFASFDGAAPHPFTISKAPDDVGTVRMSVAKLGDSTRNFHRDLKVGSTARIEGPFGRFERKDGASPEIWIAAGIGITPFLAWAHALKAQTGAIHLFYCVKTESQAAHLDELKKLVADKPALHLHMHISESSGRISADKIEQAAGIDLAKVSIAFCGPKPMRKDLMAGFGKLGVATRKFRYEEFEIRTGVGLKYFAGLLFQRTLGQK
jgi:predicted ferric reductase